VYVGECLVKTTFFFNLLFTPGGNDYLPIVNLRLPAMLPATFIMTSEQEKSGAIAPNKAETTISDYIGRTVHKEEQEMTRYFSDKRFIGAIWGVIRVWLGYSFITAGWEKLTDPQGMWIGSKAGTVVTGFLQGAIKNSTGAHASVHPWYASLAQNFFLPNATLFSYLVAFGETLVGIALIVGIFTRFAAAMGMSLNLAFMFAGSTGTNVEMVIAEVAIVAGGMYASYYGLDHFVMPYLKRLLHIGAPTTETVRVTAPNIQPATSSQ
jgi:thiosulfate dehydrogenase (quinone) large subunit